MFDKVKFANILRKISNTYDNQREFSEKSKINRTYLSKYLNMKLEQPPKPETLEKLAIASKGCTTYDELMYVCGYIDYGFGNYNDVTDLLKDTNITKSEWTYFWKDFYDLNLSYKESIALNKLQEQFYNITINPKKLNKNEFYKYFDKDLFNNYSQKEIDRIWKAFFIYSDCFDFINGRKKDKDFPIPKRSYLVDNTNVDIESVNDKLFYMCPVYGKISAGIPNWAEECLEGYVPIDPNLMDIVNPEECFFLKVNGESMNKVIRNGAYALIRKQDIVKDGEIAAVLVNGFEATLKKFTKQEDLVILEPMSDDASFTTQVYNKDTDIKILGKYIGKFEMNK